MSEEPDEIFATGRFDLGPRSQGSWNATQLTRARTAIDEIKFVRADLHAAAIAERDEARAHHHAQKGHPEMTDQERIDRLERVLAVLIGWLYRELGQANAIKLLDTLTKEDTPK